ncbi:MAG: outer membrane lipoprotein chaperone LolA [Deltaproteobacteria bacterium]|nr:outer membrane lipoprotein chaperone LolA [Deltaproteobacteria bacterium]
MLTTIFTLALAAGSTPTEMVEHMQKSFDAAQDFSAEFVHTHYAAARKGKGRAESGQLFIKKPGLMRWDYAEPNVKNFVIDGKRLWFYKPEEAQVIVNDKYQEADISAGLSFLWTAKRLTADFDVRHFTGPDPQGKAVPTDAVKLTPKNPDPNVKDVVFYLGKDGMIEKAMAKDHLGNLNVLELKNIKLNQGLKKEAFLFVPPDGVKVVHVD